MCAVKEVKETSLLLNPPLKDTAFLQMLISEIGSERSFTCKDSIKLSYFFMVLRMSNKVSVCKECLQYNVQSVIVNCLVIPIKNP